MKRLVKLEKYFLKRIIMARQVHNRNKKILWQDPTRTKGRIITYMVVSWLNIYSLWKMLMEGRRDR